jgi:hypothetical protein
MPSREDSTDRRPVPDPTLLTTQQLTREIGSLKEVLVTRLDGMDKAIVVLNATREKMPAEIDSHIHQLRDLILEKFETVQERFTNIQTQFRERDVRVEQTARDTKLAVDAAFQAAEKTGIKQTEAFTLSIAKSEGVTSKQIDAQGLLISSMTAGLSGQINEVKERLTRMESENLGQANAANSRQASTSSNVGIIGLIVVGIIGVASIIVTLMTQHFVK